MLSRRRCSIRNIVKHCLHICSRVIEPADDGGWRGKASQWRDSWHNDDALMTGRHQHLSPAEVRMKSSTIAGQRHRRSTWHIISSEHSWSKYFSFPNGFIIFVVALLSDSECALCCQCPHPHRGSAPGLNVAGGCLCLGWSWAVMGALTYFAAERTLTF